jgi:hypothetical protein
MLSSGLDLGLRMARLTAASDELSNLLLFPVQACIVLTTVRTGDGVLLDFEPLEDNPARRERGSDLEGLVSDSGAGRW